MKTLIAIVLVSLLAACGSGQPNAVQSDTAIEVVQQPATIEQPAVEVTVSCSPTTYVPCDNSSASVQTPVIGTPPDGYDLCDAWSYNPCATPTWIPKQGK